jgi:hypothetical protein
MTATVGGCVLRGADRKFNASPQHHSQAAALLCSMPLLKVRDTSIEIHTLRP